MSYYWTLYEKMRRYPTNAEQREESVGGWVGGVRTIVGGRREGDQNGLEEPNTRGNESPRR